MKRIVTLSVPLLLVTACSSSPPAATNTVDINAAAVRAQGAVDAYASSEPVEIGEPDAKPDNGMRDEEDNAAGDADQAPLDPPAPGTPGGLPDDRTPVAETAFTPDSAQGAANVVQIYYALLGERKYAQAFALREPGQGARAGDVAAFAAGFSKYGEYHANIGAPGAIDAGAGQRYVTVPVQTYARLKRGGTPVYEIGAVTLHRAGEIDGATKAQRTWRIRSIDLKPVPNR